jgi:hypothetical protein
MSDDWSARWCSLDEICDITHLIFTKDGSAAGLARGHCIIETAHRPFAISLQSVGGEHTGFWQCPSSNCLVILFEDAVGVVDPENPSSHAAVDVTYLAGPPLVSSRYLVLWSFWAITLIKSSTEIIVKRYDDADIETVALLGEPERLEMRMFVAGETVERTLLL